MWVKFALPHCTHLSRDTAHAQWLQTHCQTQWYPTGDVITHNSRTDNRRIFKLGGGVDHVTRHVRTLTKVERSRSQGHVMYQQSERYNWATDGRINFKLSGNFHLEVYVTRDTLPWSVGQLERK